MRPGKVLERIRAGGKSIRIADAVRGGGKKDDHINVLCSEEDECYVAGVPDLRHCEPR